MSQQRSIMVITLSKKQRSSSGHTPPSDLDLPIIDVLKPIFGQLAKHLSLSPVLEDYAIYDWDLRPQPASMLVGQVPKPGILLFVSKELKSPDDYVTPLKMSFESKKTNRITNWLLSSHGQFDPSASLPNIRKAFPTELAESLKRFRKDYPNSSKCAFIMMRFGTTKAHNEIVQSIRDTLGAYGIKALRADDKDYHDDLFWNILTYIHGCDFGVAVFERIEQEEFNPNISLEVGYTMALRKPVLLLKDKTLKNLNTDLIGKLYKIFDPQNISESIAPQLQRWLKDKNIIT